MRVDGQDTVVDVLGFGFERAVVELNGLRGAGPERERAQDGEDDGAGVRFFSRRPPSGLLAEQRGLYQTPRTRPPAAGVAP